ncbi:MAG TPA: hypothetical protein VF628_02280 [Allosphingosinicella sp.]|jgi:hypothetical protein
MSTQGSSLERAFRDQCAQGSSGIAGGEADAHQLDMLRGPDGKLPGNVFQLVRQGKARGPGRPAGAGNKRNQKLAQLICQEHGDPVLFMASIYSMPTDQLVELLKLADDSAAMEDRLFRLAESVERQIAVLMDTGTATAAARKQLESLVDRLGDISKVLRTKPGALAVQALALQKQAAQAVAEYVHGKQPVSVNVHGKADMVLLVPGLNAPVMDPKHLESEVRARGLEAVDLENMTLIEGDGCEVGDD